MTNQDQDKPKTWLEVEDADLVLNPARLKYLEKKLDQYEIRVKKELGQVSDRDPKAIEEWYICYDSLMKKVVLDHLLHKGFFTREDMMEEAIAAADVLWEGHIPNNHNTIIEKALNNAIRAITAYNEGKMGEEK